MYSTNIYCILNLVPDTELIDNSIMMPEILSEPKKLYNLKYKLCGLTES